MAGDHAGDAGDRFHDHLDLCERCRERPFDLCPEGIRLIREAGEAVGVVPGEQDMDIREVLTSVQPMTRLVADDGLEVVADFGIVLGSSEREHTPGDGTFCECFARCYVCHPETEEERVEREARAAQGEVAFKALTLPVIRKKRSGE